MSSRGIETAIWHASEAQQTSLHEIELDNEHKKLVTFSIDVFSCTAKLQSPEGSILVRMQWDLNPSNACQTNNILHGLKHSFCSKKSCVFDPVFIPVITRNPEVSNRDALAKLIVSHV